MNAGLASVPAGARLLPVLTVPSPATAGAPAGALAAGGARCAEVTFRTPAAEHVLKTMAAHGGPAADARFVVSPGFDEEIVAKCREPGVPVGPGIATATELMRALKAGLDTVKAFPAERSAACGRCGRSRLPTSGTAHGALVMTTPGDVSMATLTEVEALIAGGSAHVWR